ncbi:hypothetical protein OCK74_12065 [Chitinophagaceae bacterium LB-8]|uniref:Peroxidase n=1 Tax=Paraflavisolibacter caeni TaxID=2982496 RepID=A0A9X2XWL4_9BACT|nr:hypothetical protein [Paraflavisolibacter caeni]MCU7549857.1 hypothetical protein [Paraflavisolibacter caeni]
MINLSQPIDLTDPDAEAFLRGIQGNIIKGHGRDHTSHLILKIIGEIPAAKKWIADFSQKFVTSAAASNRMTMSWKADVNSAGEPFFMFLLTAEGYRKLGFTDQQIPSPMNIPFGGVQFDPYFKLGMKVQTDNSLPRKLPDPPVDQWETPYQDTIHAMVLLADDSKERLEHSITEISNSIKGIFQTLTIERGDVLRKKFLRGELVVEHFGFQDGISQPLMIRQDIDKEIAKRGNAHWDPSAPLSLVLVEEPVAPGNYGSFMVFRKLEQNVKSFWESVEELAGKLGKPVDESAALAVGRSQDGIPLLPTAVIVDGTDANDFHYDQDDKALLCPFHAHIRKTNPRGDVPRNLPAPAEFERFRRVVRRGITYGYRPDIGLPSGGSRPEKEVGLLFMCFQSNLDQFVIQQEGSDEKDFVVEGVGPDATIGQSSAPVPQTWPGNVKHTMANFVKLKGGEYFFSPSISFLTGL